MITKRPNDKYLIILVSVYLSYMDDWKKAPEAYFAKTNIEFGCAI